MAATDATGPAGVRTLTVLGCDGSYPGPGGAASGYLVQAGGTTVWLDAGPGTFANLQRVVDPEAVDAVVLSHEHPDHWTDLESFAVWRWQAGRRPAVPVYAPPGLHRRSYFARRPGPGLGGGGPGRSGCSSAGSPASFVATDHGPPTLAVRLDPAEAARPATCRPRSPTRPTPARTGRWRSWAGASGTVLCEATYTLDHEGTANHLSGRQAGRMAAAAGVGRLVLTHRWPTVSAEALADEAEEAFGRPVHQARTGAVFEW